jgi:hypothetical protein
MRSAVLVAAIVGLSVPGFAQQGHHPTVPPRHDPNPARHVAPAVHHFYLHDDGGTIDVAAKDPKDAAALDAIRLHVQKIALQFGEGEFAMPHGLQPAPEPAASADHVMFVARQHGTTDHAAAGPVASIFVPGTATLLRLKSDVKYTATKTDTGSRIEIVTTNPQAVQAVHEYLRFQINELRTGDLDAVVRRTYQTRESTREP